MSNHEVIITIRAGHSEKSDGPLRQALERFTNKLKTIGYVTSDATVSDLPKINWVRPKEPAPAPAPAPPPPPPAKEVEVRLRYLGGGYYSVVVDGEDVEKVRGKASAAEAEEAWLKKVGGQK